MVRQLKFEKVKFLVDALGESEPPDEKLNGADATMSEPASEIAEIVADAGGGEENRFVAFCVV